MGVTAAVIGAVAAAGGTGMAIKAREDAHHYAHEAESAERMRVKQRDTNLAQLREVFGIGNSTSAKGNASTLSQAIEKFYKESLTGNLHQADDMYANTSRTSRQNLARVGQLGSGLDSASRSGTLSDYLRARQSAVSQAASARDRLTNSLTSQRLGLESQISGGSIANPDFGAIAGQRDSTLASAQSSIVPAAVGNLFNAAGNTYFNGRMQEAQGNQGLQAFGFSDQSNRGRIS